MTALNHINQSIILMLRFFKQIEKRVLNIYPEWVCRREYKAQRFHRFNERPVD